MNTKDYYVQRTTKVYNSPNPKELVDFFFNKIKLTLLS